MYFCFHGFDKKKYLNQMRFLIFVCARIEFGQFLYCHRFLAMNLGSLGVMSLRIANIVICFFSESEHIGENLSSSSLHGTSSSTLQHSSSSKPLETSSHPPHASSTTTQPSSCPSLQTSSSSSVFKVKAGVVEDWFSL